MHVYDTSSSDERAKRMVAVEVRWSMSTRKRKSSHVYIRILRAKKRQHIPLHPYIMYRRKTTHTIYTNKKHGIYLLVGRQGETHGGRGGVVVNVDEVAEVERECSHIPSLCRLHFATPEVNSPTKLITF